MQKATHYFISIFSVISFTVAILLSGCSTIKDEKKIKSDKNITESSSNPVPESFKHLHPSNPCTVAVSHSHHFEDKEHEHSYDCENTNEFTRNAHVHPATKLNKRFRHVHPNGASKHSHHKE